MYVRVRLFDFFRQPNHTTFPQPNQSMSFIKSLDILELFTKPYPDICSLRMSYPDGEVTFITTQGDELKMRLNVHDAGTIARKYDGVPPGLTKEQAKALPNESLSRLLEGDPRAAPQGYRCPGRDYLWDTALDWTPIPTLSGILGELLWYVRGDFKRHYHALPQDGRPPIEDFRDLRMIYPQGDVVFLAPGFEIKMHVSLKNAVHAIETYQRGLKRLPAGITRQIYEAMIKENEARRNARDDEVQHPVLNGRWDDDLEWRTKPPTCFVGSLPPLLRKYFDAAYATCPRPIEDFCALRMKYPGREVAFLTKDRYALKFELSLDVALLLIYAHRAWFKRLPFQITPLIVEAMQEQDERRQRVQDFEDRDCGYDRYEDPPKPRYDHRAHWGNTFNQLNE